MRWKPWLFLVFCFFGLNWPIWPGTPRYTCRLTLLSPLAPCLHHRQGPLRCATYFLRNLWVISFAVSLFLVVLLNHGPPSHTLGLYLTNVNKITAISKICSMWVVINSLEVKKKKGKEKDEELWGMEAGSDFYNLMDNCQDRRGRGQERTFW